jgi:hypothetical protein
VTARHVIGQMLPDLMFGCLEAAMQGYGDQQFACHCPNVMTSMISRFHKKKQATAGLGRDLSVMVRLLRFPNRVGNPTEQTCWPVGVLSISEEKLP